MQSNGPFKQVSYSYVRMYTSARKKTGDIEGSQTPLYAIHLYILEKSVRSGEGAIACIAE